MAKRRRKILMQGGFIAELPFASPFSIKQWGKKQLGDVIENRTGREYFESCMRDIVASGRARQYINIFAMIAHLGRLPDFDKECYDRLLVNHNQSFSENQLIVALELILATSGPQQLLPTAAAAFEFLAFVGIFVDQCAGLLVAADRATYLAQQINSMALMAFSIAVNADLGIKPGFWSFQFDCP